MIESVKHDPPRGSFHEKLRIIILVREKGIEREAYAFALFFYLSGAYVDDCFSKVWSHTFLWDEFGDFFFDLWMDGNGIS